MIDEPLRRWVTLIQAPEGYLSPLDVLRPKDQTPIDLRLDSVLRVVDVEAYLDETITMWEKLRDEGGDDYALKAPYYIDAYRSARICLLGVPFIEPPKAEQEV